MICVLPYQKHSTCTLVSPSLVECVISLECAAAGVAQTIQHVIAECPSLHSERELCRTRLSDSRCGVFSVDVVLGNLSAERKNNSVGRKKQKPQCRSSVGAAASSAGAARVSDSSSPLHSASHPLPPLAAMSAPRPIFFPSSSSLPAESARRKRLSDYRNSLRITASFLLAIKRKNNHLL